MSVKSVGILIPQHRERQQMIDMQGFPALNRPARPYTFQDPGIRKELVIEGTCRLNIAFGDRESPELLERHRQGWHSRNVRLS